MAALEECPPAGAREGTATPVAVRGEQGLRPLQIAARHEYVEVAKRSER